MAEYGFLAGSVLLGGGAGGGTAAVGLLETSFFRDFFEEG